MICFSQHTVVIHEGICRCRAARTGDRNFSQFVVIHLGTDGKLSIKNTSAAVSTHVLVDIVGYFT